jgi:S-adenosylmethionine/arginine decarboxylase-like enzyme
MKEHFVPNHLHLIVKGYVTNPPKATEILNDWFIRLVNKVRMVVVAGPTSVYVSDPGNEGLTGTVTLATSHAAIHIWDNDVPPMFQFDIYSCSVFTVEEVLEHLNEFGLVSCEYICIDRNGESMTVTKQEKLDYNVTIS